MGKANAGDKAAGAADKKNGVKGEAGPGAKGKADAGAGAGADKADKGEGKGKGGAGNNDNANNDKAGAKVDKVAADAQAQAAGNAMMGHAAAAPAPPAAAPVAVAAMMGHAQVAPPAAAAPAAVMVDKIAAPAAAAPAGNVSFSLLSPSFLSARMTAECDRPPPAGTSRPSLVRSTALLPRPSSNLLVIAVSHLLSLALTNELMVISLLGQRQYLPEHRSGHQPVLRDSAQRLVCLLLSPSPTSFAACPHMDIALTPQRNCFQHRQGDFQRCHL